ncbi:MAG: antitermination protein NusB, partial [Flavobacteriaceae bacterium]|nr:antitermination protein NusB [Flavobacteriaceae bacterium]
VYSFYVSKNNDLKNEINFFHKSVSNIFELYYCLILLLVTIYKYSSNQTKNLKKAKLDVSKKINNYQKIKDNIILFFLEKKCREKNKKFKKISEEWNLENKYIKLLIDELFNSIFFNKYILIKKPTFNQQKQLILDFFTKIIATSDYISEYLYDKELTWEDDLPVVNTFIVKQIKSITLSNNNNFKIPETKSFNEDIFFGEKLLKICINKNEEILMELKGKTPNWEIDRITSIDLITLKVAIAEILNFKLIPTKVSINEYIEISKDYSTPKSNIFINGVLDKLVKEFELKNRMNKVGRGLI